MLGVGGMNHGYGGGANAGASMSHYGASAGGGGMYAGGARGAAGDDCHACGVSCGGGGGGGGRCGGGGGGGGLSYVGGGQGSYAQETTYKYVGYGGDFDVVRPRRDFTCLITSCGLLSLLLLLPLLCWLLSGSTTSLPFDCDAGFANWESLWSSEQQDYCCTTAGRGCPRPTTVPPTPVPTLPPVTPPPTPPPTRPPTPPPTPAPPVGPVDPFNCAVDAEATWAADKKAWCCRVHNRGRPPTAPPPVVMPIAPPVMPIAPPRPADPYNCADGFENWMAGWSVDKKAWCCKQRRRKNLLAPTEASTGDGCRIY